MNIWLIFAVFAAALVVFAMIDILRVRMSNNKKIIWFIVVVVLPVIGPLVYLMRKSSLIES
ncbi:PLD nuclease N-terminal domain-containing protein [Ekhidna sp.]|uniref:PLD nuclease N-terminal domain-containing protein n=1 Tax=Ekhidna sp. TaxID=2608089 RepID=UPI003BAD5A16